MSETPSEPSGSLQCSRGAHDAGIGFACGCRTNDRDRGKSQSYRRVFWLFVHSCG